MNFSVSENPCASLCCLHVFSVLCTVFPKYSNLFITNILCNHREVFLQVRCFSAHIELFTCYRYNFRSLNCHGLQNFSVLEISAMSAGFFPVLVYAANNNGFPCDCYSIVPENLHYQRQQQSPANLALCAEFDCNG